MAKIDRVINLRKKDPNKIYFLMQIRALQGLHFFAESHIKYNKENMQVSSDLLKRYIKTTEILHNKLFENKKVQENSEIEK